MLSPGYVSAQIGFGCIAFFCVVCLRGPLELPLQCSAKRYNNCGYLTRLWLPFAFFRICSSVLGSPLDTHGTYFSDKNPAKKFSTSEFKISVVLFSTFWETTCGFTYLTLLCWIINFAISDLSRGDFISESLLNFKFRCRHLLQIETPALGLDFEIQAMSFREDLRKVRKKASFCITHWTQQNGSSNTSSQWVVQAISGWIYLEILFRKKRHQTSETSAFAMIQFHSN